jgi:hypothetical protein
MSASYAWVAALGVLLVALIGWRLAGLGRRRKAIDSVRASDRRQRRLTLDALGFDAIHDLSIRDQQGRVVHVDHLVRLPASLLLVKAAPPDVAGRVLAEPDAGVWRYLDRRKRVTRIANPVIEMHAVIHAIRSRYPLVRERILTVFPNSAELPPSRRHICKAEDFAAAVKALAEADAIQSPAVQTAWEPLTKALLEAARTPIGGRKLPVRPAAGAVTGAAQH